MAVKPVDFADYDVRFDQLNFLMPDVGPTAGGFGYTLGVAATASPGPTARTTAPRSAPADSTR
jgi:hypothetical protein